MYVSDKYRMAFVHIPKTGGTAIKRNVLRATQDGRRVGAKHSAVLPVPDSYFTFAFVRNPYARIASSYRYRLLCPLGDVFKAMVPRLSMWLDGTAVATTPDEHKLLNAHPWAQTSYVNGTVDLFRFETFAEDVVSICRRVGLAMPPMKKTKDTLYFGEYDWHDFIDKRALDLINTFCRDDFLNLGYPMLTWDKFRG